MDERRCVEVLRAHNEWRRYDGLTGEPGAPAMVNPTELGQALDHAIATIERGMLVGVSNVPKGRVRDLEYRVVDDRALLHWQGIPVKVCGVVGTHPKNWSMISGSGAYPKETPLPDPQPDGQEGAD